MKRTLSTILILAISVGLLVSLSACGADLPPDEELSPLVAEAVLAEAGSGYYRGECSGEGHKVLGSSVSGSRLKVYALTTYGNYGFRNDMFIKVSGSGVIPAVLTFEKSGGEYELLAIEYPYDGAGYAKSIKRMFPLKYRSAALNGHEKYDELAAMERGYAEAYLKGIGRDAVIGEYSDLNTVLLTDLGVSVEVSNQLSCDKALGDYPYWIGSAEFLEDGRRYVRSLSYDDKEGQVIYTTCEKESGEVTEKFVFDAVTGEPIELLSTPAAGGLNGPGGDAGTIREDACALYLDVLEDLWNVDSGLNGGISRLGIDLSELSHLTEAEKETVMREFASKHNLPYIAGTWEELCELGYIDKGSLLWKDGLLFSIKTNEDAVWNLPAIKEGGPAPELTSFDAQKWRSGTGAYFFGQCTARKNADGTWLYTVGQEAIS